MKQDEDRQQQSPWAALGILGVIGIDLATTLLIGLWVGRKVDSWLHTAPLFMLIGMFLGIAAGVWSVIHLIKPYLGDKNG